VPWLVHLSDLHLLGHPSEQSTILRSLVAALGAERRRRGRPADLVCLTGDVFESATLPKAEATGRFSDLLDEIHEALGGRVPTVIVPGNHDRRRNGLFLPHDESLFDELRRVLRGRAWVHGCERPFLSEVVPPAVHGLPLWLVAYDSNHLPKGAIGAGGSIRQEDLLRAAAIIDGHEPDWPVLLMLHHHLIPTPLTDLGPIEVDDAPRPVRWLVERGLPRLLANADREELFMTALGAGTALSTLHAMGRAVLVLHGHKHYATSRLLSATHPGQGDVLIVSAGSAGTAQVWRPSPHRDTARLWPSFNVIAMDRDRIDVQQIAFGWRDVSEAVARRPMVTAARRGARWIPAEIEDGGARGPSGNAVEPGPRLALNEERVELLPARRHGRGRWDVEVRRRVRFRTGGPRARYVETVDGPANGRLVLGPGALRSDGARSLPAQLQLDPRREARYLLEGGVPRTVAEESRIAGSQATPYGRIALMNRYQCERATLVVQGLRERARTAFGSATDLGTGLERPVPIEADEAADRIRLTVEDCPPRTLIRLYWLLEDERVPTGAGVVPPPSPSPEARPASPEAHDRRTAEDGRPATAHRPAIPPISTLARA
jgi:3',5'-cyclic AMP phosphodiesterase CpdA